MPSGFKTDNSDEMEILRRIPTNRTGQCPSMLLTISFFLITAICAGESLGSLKTDTPDSASTLYRSALIKERALRTPAKTLATDEGYIAAIDAFKRVANEYPNGPYAAQAIWQAAGLCLAAFERWHDDAFIELGTNLLLQLKADYSHSPLSRRVPDRLSLFETVDSYSRLTSLSKTLIGDTIRYTLQLSHETIFTTEHLRNPTRVFFDLSDTTVPDNVNVVTTPHGTPDPSVRIGARNNNTTRVVLDLPQRTRCTVLNLYEPFRIVADCHPPPTNPPTPVVTPTHRPEPIALEKDSETPLTLPRQLGLGISRIVIDPGHGGRDPGATGNGLTEARLTLDLAQRLTTQLHASGIEVILTRQSDEFVPLEQRVDLTTRNNADLLLSLHVNASQREDTRGVETYVLDFADDNESRLVAARENQQATRTLSELDSYVRAIANSAKTSESDQLAIYIQRHLVTSLRTLDPEIPNLGIKHAPFVVLLGTQVPSVLVEVGFLSNARDAALLKTEHFLDLVASAITTAVLQYRNDLQSDTPHQLENHAQIN